MTNERKAARFEGIDGWRAVLLVMGAGTHAMTAPTGAYQWVGVATHAFRMEAFFAVSGFLAAIALQRQLPGVWLRSRLTVLSIPMLVAFFILNPVTAVLSRWATGARTGQAVSLTENLRPTFDHVWFLWVLIVFSVAAAWLAAHERALLVRVQRVGTWGTSIVSHRLGWPTLLAVLYAVLLPAAWLEQGVRSASVLHPFSNGTLSHKVLTAFIESGTVNIPYYIVFFLMGIGIARLQEIRRACADFWSLHALLVLFGVAWAIASYRSHGVAVFPYLYDSASAQPAYIWINKVLIGLPATLLILRHGLSVSWTPMVLKVLARASYTIFVCHMLLIAFVMCVLGPGWWGSIGHYFAVVGLAIVGSYAIHVGLVERSAGAALLLNGRVGWMHDRAERGRVMITDVARRFPASALRRRFSILSNNFR